MSILSSVRTLGVTGLATVGSEAVTGNETVGGTLGVTSDETVGGNLGVTGTATLGGAAVTGNEIVNDVRDGENGERHCKNNADQFFHARSVA